MHAINDTNTVNFNIPVGQETLKNVSNNFERDLLKTLLEVLQDPRFPPDYRGAFAMVVIEFLMFAIIATFCVKKYRRVLRNNETQRNPA